MFKNYISKKCNTKKRQTILGSKNLIWLRPIYDSMLTQSLPLYREFLWNLLSPPTTRLIPDTVSVDSLSKPKHCKSDCAGLQIRRQLVNGCWTVGFLRLNASAQWGHWVFRVWVGWGRDGQESSALSTGFPTSLPLEATQYMRGKDVMHSGWEEMDLDAQTTRFHTCLHICKGPSILRGYCMITLPNCFISLSWSVQNCYAIHC